MADTADYCLREVGASPAPAARSGILGRLKRSRVPAPAYGPVDAESSQAPGESVRPVDRLVALQGADGSWSLTAEFAKAIGADLPSLEKHLTGLAGNAPTARRALATALALAWLERHAAAERDEWRLLAGKARAWLDAASIAGRDGRSLEAIAGEAV
jgi:hypothetical protein